MVHGAFNHGSVCSAGSVRSVSLSSESCATGGGRRASTHLATKTELEPKLTLFSRNPVVQLIISLFASFCLHQVPVQSEKITFLHATYVQPPSKECLRNGSSSIGHRLHDPTFWIPQATWGMKDPPAQIIKLTLLSLAPLSKLNGDLRRGPPRQLLRPLHNVLRVTKQSWINFLIRTDRFYTRNITQE